MQNFPPLRMGVIAALMPLREAIIADPTLLDSDECPYDEETKDLLRQLFKERIVEVEVEVEKIIEVEAKPKKETGNRRGEEVSDEDVDEVERDAKDLLTELKNLGNGEAHLDTQAKVQIIKTKAALMERLVVMRERITNVKKMSEFQNTVLEILQDLVDEKYRDEFLKRIKPYTEA